MAVTARMRRSPLRAGKVGRVLVASMFAWSTVAFPVAAGAQTPPAGPQAQPAPPAPPPPPAPAQAPAPAAPEAARYSMSDLEYIFGPIALYPDPLLAILMPAAAFPDQIVAADKWIENNPRTVAARNFALVDKKPWDSSVKALARFPDVIALLADHMEWTESIGYAFVTQPQDVSNVIQMLRARAEQVGNLKTNEQQVVTTRESGGRQVIYIAPANPERIYVPVYDSSSAFTTFATGALLFGTGVVVGSAWNNRWGWNNRGWNTVWVVPPAWRRPPHWGWGPGARPPAWGPGPWRPGRPNVPPPNRPGRPDRPGIGPDRPGIGPGRPGLRPDRPGARPGRPGRPGVGPDRPGVRPDRPGARPDRPAARPDRPANRPAQGARDNVRNRAQQARPKRNAQPQRNVRPNRQAAPQRNARPNRQATPHRNVRPQQRARPHQNARPRQNARPAQRGRPVQRHR